VHRRERYDKLLTHAWMKNMEIMPEVFFIVLPRNLMLYRCETVIAVIYLLQTLRLRVFLRDCGKNGGKIFYLIYKIVKILNFTSKFLKNSKSSKAFLFHPFPSI
jgi:hypothetical protein